MSSTEHNLLRVYVKKFHYDVKTTLIYVYNGRMGVIEFRLSELMGRHRIKQRALAEAAGVRPAAINALYHGKRERVNMDQLAAILDGLNMLTGQQYGVADLLAYKAPDVEKATDVPVMDVHLEILNRLERGEGSTESLKRLAALHKDGHQPAFDVTKIRKFNVRGSPLALAQSTDMTAMVAELRGNVD